MEIITSRKFDKSFKKQSLKVKKEFESRIELFIIDINDPVLRTHKLSGNLKNLWSFNVSGDIRVIFEKKRKKVIFLIDIGTHSELYS
jgi:addiction module RelE/StbE family toxin